MMMGVSEQLRSEKMKMGVSEQLKSEEDDGCESSR
jgi:hypothetical protein